MCHTYVEGLVQSHVVFLAVSLDAVSSYEPRLVVSEGYLDSVGGDHVISLAHTIRTSDTRESM